jgi:mono/diheme cytochrome c family protein
MITLVRGGAPFAPVVVGSSCLLLLVVGLPALQAQSLDRSTSVQVVGPVSTGSQALGPDRIPAGHSRSIRLYRSHCIDCHETNGRGEMSRLSMPAIPDFTRPDWHRARSNDRLAHSIREGKGFMPAWKDQLAATDVVELVSLVRNFRDGRQVVPDDSGNEEDSSKPSEEEKPAAPTTSSARSPQRVSLITSEVVNPRSDAARGLFQRFCVSCHDADGHGNAMRARMPRIPDFTTPAWQQQRSDAQLRTSILEGKGTAMPTFSGRLDETQVRNLVTYVRSFAPASPRLIQEPPTDFSRRFQQLQNEMNALKRQYRALSTP